MERLIVEIQYGDGFTYSAEDHLPVVFSSKEEFIITLEDKIKQTKEQLELQNKLVRKGHDELQNKLDQLRKLKNPTEKIKAEYQEELKKLMAKNAELTTEYTKMQNIVIGGQTFHISNFVEENFVDGQKTEFVHLPQVWTVDEYFAEVEKASSKQQ